MLINLCLFVKKHRKELWFKHNGKLYDILALTYSLFTKLLKPAVTKLRGEGILLIGYIDDIILIAENHITLKDHIQKNIGLLKSSCFTIHTDTSMLIRNQRAVFLRFMLDTVAMTVNMTDAKTDKVKSAIQALLNQNQPKIWDVLFVVGLMVSNFSGVRYRPLYYRTLKKEKTDMLKSNGGNLDKTMFISWQAQVDLHWCLSNVTHSFPTKCNWLKASQFTYRLGGCHWEFYSHCKWVMDIFRGHVSY